MPCGGIIFRKSLFLQGVNMWLGVIKLTEFKEKYTLLRVKMEIWRRFFYSEYDIMILIYDLVSCKFSLNNIKLKI